MVSAILLGTSVAVPKGKDVGGSFQHVPLCRSTSQTGLRDHLLVVPLDDPAAGEHALRQRARREHGRGVRKPGRARPAAAASCTRISTRRPHDHRHPPAEAVGDAGKTVDTPWVSVPGLLTAKCASNENASGYLEVTVHGDPADPRIDDIVGDVTSAVKSANWGLHLIDVNLAMGNLLDIVAAESKAYVAKSKSQ